jgi:Icc-related predicted phosphoesterase
MLKVWCISDTHGTHRLLKVPQGMNVAVFAGDAGGPRDAASCVQPIRDFLDWFESIKIEHKIYVPGNHDTAIEAGLIDFSEWPSITLLVDDSVNIEGHVFYGSPWTPTFGNGWAYNMDRDKAEAHWAETPDEVDVFISHGPPLGILDLTRGLSKGDAHLASRIEEIRPLYHIFGHFHNEGAAVNSMIFNDYGITYVNASCVNNWHELENNGKIIGL